MADNHTVVAEHGAVRGTIRGAEDVVVFGYVEGRVELDGTFFVEPPGIVKADVQANHIVVAGVVVGDLRARDCIEILPTGRVVGNLTTPRLVMAAGGAVRGRVTMEVAGAPEQTAPQLAPPTRQAPPPHRPATAPRAEAPAVDRTPVRIADEPVWRRPTLQMPAVQDAPVTSPAPAAPPAAPTYATRAAPAPGYATPAAPAPHHDAPAAPAPQHAAPAEPVYAAPAEPAPVAAPVPPAPQAAPPAHERVLPPPDRPFQTPKPPRRSFEDLDTLFPVIPESSMDGWAVSVPAKRTPDDSSGSGEG